LPLLKFQPSYTALYWRDTEWTVIWTIDQWRVFISDENIIAPQYAVPPSSWKDFRLYRYASLNDGDTFWEMRRYV